MRASFTTSWHQHSVVHGFVNESLRRRDLPVSDIDADGLHILLTAYWCRVQPLVHRFPGKRRSDCKRIARF